MLDIITSCCSSRRVYLLAICGYHSYQYIVGNRVYLLSLTKFQFVSSVGLKHNEISVQNYTRHLLTFIYLSCQPFWFCLYSVISLSLSLCLPPSLPTLFSFHFPFQVSIWRISCTIKTTPTTSSWLPKRRACWRRGSLKRWEQHVCDSIASEETPQGWNSEAGVPLDVDL